MPNASPLKHEIVRWVRQCEETLSRGFLLITCVGSWKKTRIIGDDGHFCAIITCLVKYAVLEHHEYIRILFESRVKVPIVALELWGGAVKPLRDLSPFLL